MRNREGEREKERERVNNEKALWKSSRTVGLFLYQFLFHPDSAPVSELILR